MLARCPLDLAGLFTSWLLFVLAITGMTGSDASVTTTFQRLAARFSAGYGIDMTRNVLSKLDNKENNIGFGCICCVVFSACGGIRASSKLPALTAYFFVLA